MHPWIVETSRCHVCVCPGGLHIKANLLLVGFPGGVSVSLGSKQHVCLCMCMCVVGGGWQQRKLLFTLLVGHCTRTHPKSGTQTGQSHHVPQALESESKPDSTLAQPPRSHTTPPPPTHLSHLLPQRKGNGLGQKHLQQGTESFAGAETFAARGSSLWQSNIFEDAGL